MSETGNFYLGQLYEILKLGGHTNIIVIKLLFMIYYINILID